MWKPVNVYINGMFIESVNMMACVWFWCRFLGKINWPTMISLWTHSSIKICQTCGYFYAAWVPAVFVCLCSYNVLCCCTVRNIAVKYSWTEGVFLINVIGNILRFILWVGLKLVSASVTPYLESRISNDACLVFRENSDLFPYIIKRKVLLTG